MGQRKAFYRQRIPESICTRTKKEVEPAEPVLKNIYQSNTYRKDLSWPVAWTEADISMMNQWFKKSSKRRTVLGICFCRLSNNSK